MGQVSIILIAGLIFLFSFDGGLLAILESPDHTSLWVGLALTLLPGGLAYLWGRWLSRRAEEVTAGRFFLIKRSFLAFELILLGGFGLTVYLLKLPLAVDDLFKFIPFPYTRRLFAILPLLAGMLLIRAAQYEVERRVRASDWRRREYLSVNAKFLLLPVLPLLAYMAMNDLIDRCPLQVRLFFIDNPYLYWLVLVLLIVALYVKAPQILQGIWRATPLRDLNLRGMLAELARRTGVAFKEIMVWHTGRARIANAGVAGLLPWSRKIFLTDCLLENFSPEEIRTVVAHEFGHIKHRHIWIYLGFSLTYFLAAILYYAYLAPIWKDLLGEGPMVDALSTLLFFYLYFVLIFRYLSRRLEYQADIYSVEVTGDPMSFKISLLKLADLNYVPKVLRRVFELTLTHPSVERRIEMVDRFLAGDPEALRLRRTLPEVKLALMATFIAFGLLLNFNRPVFESEADLHYMRGVEFHREKMWDKALGELDRTISLDPSYKEAYLLRGMIYYDRGSPEKALRDFEKLYAMVSERRVKRGLQKLIDEVKREIKGRNG